MTVSVKRDVRTLPCLPNTGGLKQVMTKPDSEMTDNTIRAMRLKKGMTLDQLAKILGTTPTQISRLETGKRKLTLEWLQKLTEAIDEYPETKEFNGVIPRTLKLEKEIGVNGIPPIGPDGETVDSLVSRRLVHHCFREVMRALSKPIYVADPKMVSLFTAINFGLRLAAQFQSIYEINGLSEKVVSSIREMAELLMETLHHLVNEDPAKRSAKDRNRAEVWEFLADLEKHDLIDFSTGDENGDA